VHKFGGAALADADAVRHAAAIVAALRRPGADVPPTVVVCSAMHGVTDALLDAAHRAARGDVTGARRSLEALRARHAAAARRVGVPEGAEADEAEPDPALAAAIEQVFVELGGLVDGLAALGDLPPAVADAVLARGERLSARLLVTALAAAGVEAAYVDEHDVVHTDGRAGNAFPDLPRTAEAARRVLLPLLARGAVAVVPGFVGAAPARPSPATGTASGRGARPRWSRSGAAAPTSPRRRWPACWAHATSSSGRTCPGCSPPIRAWCPTHA
jgi:aspartate kinase